MTRKTAIYIYEDCSLSNFGGCVNTYIYYFKTDLQKNMESWINPLFIHVIARVTEIFVPSKY